MAETTIKKMLKEFGLTDTESEIYLFLSKYGASKGTQIAKQTKKDKAQIYHALKSLATKGLADSTLEVPIRFTPVPFEQIMESVISAKKAEAERMENTKKELLRYWKDLEKTKTEIVSERFTVIEGRKAIYPRLKQMVENTKSQLSIISTVSSIVRADQFGVLDAVFCNFPNTNPKVKIVIELTKDNYPVVKKFLRETAKKLGIEVRTPDLGLTSLSRMLIRDDAEVLSFINHESDKKVLDSDDLCLWTNNQTIVNSFKTVFDGLWQSSTEIQNKIGEIETGQFPSKTHVFASADAASEKYTKCIQSALEEVTILTSSQNLLDLSKQDKPLVDWAKKHVTVRIMAPITRSILNSIQPILKYSQVKHVPIGCQGITIVDGKEIFQFNYSSYETEHQNSKYFENAFYSNDKDYVEKIGKLLDDMWKTAEDLPLINLRSSDESIRASEILAENNPYRKMIGIKAVDIKPVTEKKIIDEIIQAKRLHLKNPEKDVHKIYATAGSAIIHPPSHLNLPELIIEAMQVESQSSLGPANVLSVYQWLETEKEAGYALVAMVYTSVKPWEAARQVYKNTLAGDNIQLAKEEELQIRVHGNIMFTGWTVPIPLLPQKIVLPPACLTLESYGKVQPSQYTLLTKFGARSIVRQNCFDAFVTFTHPNTKYSGAGIDGFFARDYILTLQPPV